MGSLGNTPRQQTVLKLAARKSFAFGLLFRQQEDLPIDLTGATIRFVLAEPDYRGGAVLLTRTAELIDAELGVAQVSLQAVDLNLVEDDYPFSVTIVSALGYSTLVLSGVVTISENADTGTSGTYTDIDPSTNFAVYIGNGNTLTISVERVDGMDVIVSEKLALAAAAAATAVAAAAAAEDASAVAEALLGLGIRSDRLALGQESVPREFATSLITMSSSNLRFSFFTARKSETITKIRTVSGAAAEATPTLCRVGLYEVSAAGDLTLVASTANTTSLWAAASTGYDTALSASYDVVAGVRYAVGLLCVTAASAPTAAGAVSGPSADVGRAPRISGVVGGQTNLPSTVLAASVTDSTNRPYAVLLP